MFDTVYYHAQVIPQRARTVACCSPRRQCLTACGCASGPAEAAPHLGVRVVEQRTARCALPRAQALGACAERDDAQ